MNQIVMPPKMAASANRSIVESRNAPYLPELPLILASWPSSMSVKTKHVAMNAPGNSSPIGSSQSEAAETPTVPATVIMFGVTGVRASPCTMGPNSRAKKGRRKFSMAESILLGGGIARGRATPAAAKARLLVKWGLWSCALRVHAVFTKAHRARGGDESDGHSQLRRGRTGGRGQGFWGR